jgi:hypothetical protein
VKQRILTAIEGKMIGSRATSLTAAVVDDGATDTLRQLNSMNGTVSGGVTAAGLSAGARDSSGEVRFGERAIRLHGVTLSLTFQQQSNFGTIRRSKQASRQS